METLTNRMTVFKVYINSNCVDVVFYISTFTADEVRCSLINHDGYVESIKVVKERVKK